MNKPAQEKSRYLAVRSSDPCIRVLLSRPKSEQKYDVHGFPIVSQLQTDEVKLAHGLNLVDAVRLAATGVVLQAPNGQPTINRKLTPYLEILDLPENPDEALPLIQSCRNKNTLRIWLEEIRPSSEKVRLALEAGLQNKSSFGADGQPTMTESMN